jgi:hypothetical protein
VVPELKLLDDSWVQRDHGDAEIPRNERPSSYQIQTLRTINNTKIKHNS